MVIKKFKESHPVVLFLYFLSVIVLTLIQRNCYFVTLMAIMTIFVDYIYNKNNFFKNIKYFLCIVIIVLFVTPCFFYNGKDILFNSFLLTISKQGIVYGLFLGLILGSVFLWLQIMKKIMSDNHIIYLFGSILPIFGLIISVIFNIVNKTKVQYQKIKEANYHMPVKNKFIYYRNIIVILITYMFESSLDMMNSMISRGYGKAKRTSFYLYVFKKDDALKLAMIILFDVICMFGYFIYYHRYSLANIGSFNLIDILFFVSYLLLGLLPVLIGGKKNV